MQPSSELAILEITQLHAFFGQWFRGEIAGTESVFSRVADVWGPQFEIISPDGRLRPAAELLQATFAEYGRYPHLSIRIENLLVREIAAGSVIAARYEEWHIDREIIEPRLCTATLIRPDPSREHLDWVQIHESPLIKD